MLGGAGVGQRGGGFPVIADADQEMGVRAGEYAGGTGGENGAGCVAVLKGGAQFTEDGDGVGVRHRCVLSWDGWCMRAGLGVGDEQFGVGEVVLGVAALVGGGVVGE